jgi:succinate dehydrogenase / fumarate reductase cytochrome b subunit
MQLQYRLSSSIGTKILIALTGLGLFVFLVAHLAGNLLFVVGPGAFNAYSHSLVSNPLIYLAELGLILIFVLHIGKTVSNFVANRRARPIGYSARRWAKTKSPRSRKSVASATMILTGTVTALFVVTHLLTFKFGTYYETADGVRDLYRLQLEVFSSPPYVLFYLVAMGVIFFHLWHGLTSAAQSLGVDHPVWTPRVLVLGRAVSLLVAGGFFILPIYTFLISRGVL